MTPDHDSRTPSGLAVADQQHNQAGQGDFGATFREAMSRFPSGVTIVTATDDGGCPRGFTASAFCSVSAEPPLVLVCLATSADCYPAFRRAGRWVINILGQDHTELAKRFATRGSDKFAGEEFTDDGSAGGSFGAGSSDAGGPDTAGSDADSGLPVLRDAVASLVCRVHDRRLAGDHVILVGEVTAVRLRDQPPLVHYARGFPRLSA